MRHRVSVAPTVSELVDILTEIDESGAHVISVLKDDKGFVVIAGFENAFSAPQGEKR